MRLLTAAGFGAMLRPPRRPSLRRPGVQLYTVRRLLERDFEGTLTALRAIGFREVEFAGYPDGATGREVARMLSRVGLDGPSTHVGLDRIRNRWDETVDFAVEAGHRYLVLASLPETERASLDAYRRLADELNRAAETAGRRGLRVGYHNHDFELTPLEGQLPYDVLAGATDPALVVLELDVYWMVRGGHDPVAYFRRWPGRFRLVHLKDMDRTPARGFTELGRGRIDFRRILVGAKTGGTQHYYYEQDETGGDPLASARVSFGYLESLPD